MWNTDLSRDMHPVMNPHVPGKFDKFAKGANKGAGKKAKAKGKGKGAGKKGTAPPAGLSLGQPAIVSNTKVKTARSNGKNMSCSLCNQMGARASCTYEHACNVLVSPLAVCGGNHPAHKHHGNVVPA